MVLIKYEGCSVPSGNQPLPPSQGSSTGSQSVRQTEKKKKRKEKVAHLIKDWDMDSSPVSP